MKYRLLILASAVMMCVLALGCSENTPVEITSSKLDTPDAAPHAVTRPFMAYYETVFPAAGDPALDCDENAETPSAGILGTGVATHMGASTLDMQSEVNFFEGLQCGSAVSTAANGDWVESEFAGTITLPNPPIPPFSFSFDGEFTFVGGTGRFENADGGGTYHGTGITADGVNGTGEVTYVGTITY